MPETQVQMIVAGLTMGDVGWSYSESCTPNAEVFNQVPTLVLAAGVVFCSSALVEET